MKSLQSMGLIVAIFFMVLVSSVVFGQGNLRERAKEMQRRNNSNPQAKLSLVPNTVQKSFDYEDINRTFLVHAPATYDGKKAVPLVLCFHGGIGTGQQIERTTGFSQLADKENFIAVYPDGQSNQWNDGHGRGSAFSGVPTANDVGFVSALLGWVKKNYRIDSGQIYATGVSNGGIFTNRLGIELADEFAAIAPVVGNLPINPKTLKPYAPKPHQQKPLSVLIINGVDDPLVKWQGGQVRGSTGRVTSVAETVAAWVEFGGCAAKPAVENLPDKFPDDGTTVRRETYTNGENGTEVILYAVVGGGHGWHGSTDGRPQRRRNLAGNLSREINSTEVIWEFFKRYTKQDKKVDAK